MTKLEETSKELDVKQERLVQIRELQEKCNKIRVKPPTGPSPSSMPADNPDNAFATARPRSL